MWSVINYLDEFCQKRNTVLNGPEHKPENLPIAKASQPEDIGLVSKLGLLLVMIITACTIKVVRIDALFYQKKVEIFINLEIGKLIFIA